MPAPAEAARAQKAQDEFQVAAQPHPQHKQRTNKGWGPASPAAFRGATSFTVSRRANLFVRARLPRAPC